MPGASIATAYTVLREYNVLQYGAVPDGTSSGTGTDNTSAFQAALTAAGNARGGRVIVPQGNYLIAGQLTVPNWVQLCGPNSGPTSPNGIRDTGSPLPTDGGACLMLTYGAHTTTGAIITLGWSSSISGFTIWFPNQITTGTPISYPWAIGTNQSNPNAKNCTVRDLCLLNPYQGIFMQNCERGLVENVFGQPISVGLQVDGSYDCSRFRHVHWNPIWSDGTAVSIWQQNNGVGFWFQRSDEQYCEGLFAYGYASSYRFTESSNGTTYGFFGGCCSDSANIGIDCQATDSQGVVFVGGSFVGTDGAYGANVTGGDLQIIGGRFINNAASIDISAGNLVLSGAWFRDWSSNAVTASGGTISVTGCIFNQGSNHVALSGSGKATIVGNTANGGSFSVSGTASGGTVTGSNN